MAKSEKSINLLDDSIGEYLYDLKLKMDVLTQKKNST